ncbi:diaminobutyrate acetyltransferase [Pseudonocardia sp. TRM90224]|uniref:diaminobutyrate acetyltransferase n=1 Tax=Pseudonocardia sp. TRM90224 TaxID=2812678 RepID=UPI001E4ADD8C|nr:diaminobutyrate acetyltransferase [Pseudonocardia sp. TRM90224]
MVVPPKNAAGVLGPPAGAISYGPPDVADGVECWRIARESEVLDVNSRYAYLLWCRDFASTSVVARLDGAVVGFVTGYRRPDSPSTLMVWQVAVDERARGAGVAGRMLDELRSRVDAIDRLETSITPANTASIALFSAFARRHGATVARTELFGPDVLGDEHDPEILFRIGPIY